MTLDLSGPGTALECLKEEPKLLACFECECVLSRVQLFATPWTIACQAPLSTDFSGEEYWSGLPFLLQGISPDPGTEPVSCSGR